MNPFKILQTPRVVYNGDRRFSFSVLTQLLAENKRVETLDCLTNNKRIIKAVNVYKGKLVIFDTSNQIYSLDYFDGFVSYDWFWK